MYQCIKFILFWNDTLHVSDVLSVHHQEFKTVHTDTADCLLASSQQYLFDKCLLLTKQVLLASKQSAVSLRQMSVANQTDTATAC